MSDTAPSRDNHVVPEWKPASPGLLIVPGGLLAFVGLWMLFDGGPPVAAAACLVLGGGALLVGLVAAGVAWGLDLQAHRPG